MSKTPNVRFAPSPTGELHLGGARTALFNFLFARQKGGRFFLRIEDTDKNRSRQEYVDQICESLKWMQLHWEEPIISQSERVDTHRMSVRQLIQKGKAYRCFCSMDQLNKLREEAQKERKQYQYTRICANLSQEEIKTKLNSAQPYCVRIKIPRGKTKFSDTIYGAIEVENKEIDDFIIQRTDGNPTYNLTVVIDDSDMEITHVIRGEDHIANTPKQIIIYKALDKKIPQFSHLPMILASGGQRLSKRHGATGVQEYRDSGYLSDALVNYLALLGWSPGDDREIFDMEGLIKEFDLKKVQKKGAIFDEKKLHWVGGQHMVKESPTFLVESLRTIYPEWQKDVTENYILSVIDLVKDRTKSLKELNLFTDYFFTDPTDFDEKAISKRWKDESINFYLEKYIDNLEGLNDWTVSVLEDHLRANADINGIKTALLIHPVRIAVTGFGIGPSLFNVMELLGKQTVIRRLKFAVENLPSS
tara:strand:+ start:9591 stop:11015 length:1425 start_codon:yes stop_codon:yes gene_type:complete